MFKKISEWDFVKEFDNMNRSDNFSFEGRRVLFEHIEDINPEWELDVISICVDYVEYKNIDEFLKENQNIDMEKIYINGELDEDKLEELISDITLLLKFGKSLNDGFIVQQF